MSGCIHESQRIKSSNSSQPRSCACMHVGVCVVRTSTSEIGMRGPLDNSCAGHSRWMQPLTNVSKNVKRMIGYLAKVNSLHRRSLGPQGRGSLCGCRRCWARCLACLALCKCENVKWSTSKLSKLALRVCRCCDHTRHNRIKMRYANRVRLPIPITTPDPQKTGRPVAHPIGQFTQLFANGYKHDTSIHLCVVCPYNVQGVFGCDSKRNKHQYNEKSLPIRSMRL